jgi:hypothetical protein
MQRSSFVPGAALVAACALFVSGAAHADLTKGFYSSIGTVTSANAACASIGLVAGSTSNSNFFYPGAGAKGFTIYVPPGGGILQLCTKFPAVPSGGLNGWSANPTCTIYTEGGDLPAEKVNFAFTSVQTDANSALGQTTLTIPAADPVAGGCSAVVTTTTIGSGS